MVIPQNYIVIDIGNDKIKILDLSKKKENIYLNGFALINTPQNAIDDGMLIDKNTIALEIKKVIEEKNIKTKDVLFTISSTKIITREVEFPNLKSNKLKEIIKMNASEYFPVDLENYILDFTIQETIIEKDEKKVKVNIIAASKTLCEDYVSLAELLGLRIVGIDYSGNSLVNFAKKEKLKGSYIILDIGCENTMVSIMKDGVNKFNRNLITGANNIINNIKKYYNVTYEEAIKISGEKDYLQNVDLKIREQFIEDDTDAKEQILNGVSRIIDYYTSRNSENFDTIYIVGGGSNIYGIKQFIENYFNINTKKVPNFKSVKGKNIEEFKKQEIYFACAIGAAFYNINLIPSTVVKKLKTIEKKRTGILAFILIILLMIALSVNKIRTINGLKLKVEHLNTHIEEGKAVMEIKSEYEELLKRVEFRKKIMEQSASTSEEFKEILETMENTMPDEVYSLTIVDNGSNLVMDCMAKDKMTVARFIKALKEMEFSDVYVPAISEVEMTDGETLVSFSVTCTY